MYEKYLSDEGDEWEELEGEIDKFEQEIWDKETAFEELEELIEAHPEERLGVDPELDALVAQRDKLEEEIDERRYAVQSVREEFGRSLKALTRYHDDMLGEARYALELAIDDLELTKEGR
jgi:septal ring factor EnvC (AmiA/AmiB activator)